jgi:Fe2+ transport system protein FeoA
LNIRVATPPTASSLACSPVPAPLAELPDGRPARVVRVIGEPLLRERLVELGFTPGQRVEVLSHAAGAVRVSLRGGAMALRRDEAACVLVTANPQPA